METIENKKERIKLTPEQLFNVYMECIAPGAPVKMILQRNGLVPWDLVAIRKKVKAAAIEALSRKGKPGRKQQVIPVEQYQRVARQLEETKDALAAVGHELSLLKKRTD
ncbi:hypothetical protein COY52_07205 [Candidatus Desantisbacteria bacterium CG_4_10_14_0_8_um_filter_48_22]|uniref:Transposase n=1 Tax=Candidatus Desantisbacteria bacterium CG_4_10_14_0_8_um_filter_48_22 TaxID=1974543 RepID=A0A2M7SA07_9BACT|nr:MAG: hypothetical protein AUJ67_07060 [Candidatus Desantisbacteria bacterium CG1_02_49_89]PIZ16377.1 MAG: hypothetical protein COY52_07205 [Candidatus Desantisbacteria bacterium CG_4_10_14_0_8_um_filter_48_22]